MSKKFNKQRQKAESDADENAEHTRAYDENVRKVIEENQRKFTEETVYDKATKEELREITAATRACAGGALWEETEVRDADASDVEGVLGIEGAYDHSLIPQKSITALGFGTYEKMQERHRQETHKRGGMLHRFRKAPVYWIDPEQETMSVCETMLSEIEQTRSLLRNASENQKDFEKMPPLYRVKKLVHKNHPETVLAWADWHESFYDNPAMRNEKCDQYAVDTWKEVEDIILDAGLRHEKYNSAYTLNFYTLNGRAPGAASLLFHRLLDEWKASNYSGVLLWRHKILEMVQGQPQKNKQLHLGSLAHEGNNEDSEQFFRDRKFKDIGTRLSPYLAPRLINFPQREERLIASTQGYMYGDLNQVQGASKRKQEERYEKYTKHPLFMNDVDEETEGEMPPE